VTLAAKTVRIEATESLALARAKLSTALASAGKEPAELEARLLLEGATELSPLGLALQANQPLGESCASRLQSFLERRLADEPVSRILGRSGFYGLDLVVTPDVLDPRNDTEILVDAVLAFLHERPRGPRTILDLGVGSGAILCALLNSLPDAIGIGVDLSEAACRVARLNLHRCGLSQRGFVLCGKWAGALAGQFDLIVSNPPYIGLNEVSSLAPEVARHDPPLALFAGEEGLDCYQQIAEDLQTLTKRGSAAFLEIGWRQADSVVRILDAAGFNNAMIVRDLGGRDRVIAVTKV
jgi:release factor glutamine methyltransferase